MLIARRLRLTPSDGGRRSPAVGIAIGGVALAVIVMMISMAVVLGFQDAIKKKVIGFEAPITIGPLGKYYQHESNTVDLSPALRDAIREAVPSAVFSLAIRQPVVLKTADNFAGVVLNAYGSGHDFSFEKNNLLEGRLPEKPTDIVVSSVTAAKLNLKTGDKLDGCFFVDGALKLRRLTVSGIFSSNFGDYDRLTAYGDFEMLHKLRRIGVDEGDAIELREIPIEEVTEASLALHKSLSQCYDSGELISGVNITTVFDSGAVYFNWLALLDANVVVILVIMSLVSGFTLISCVFILILQRVRMIGVLKSMGATDNQIRRIFMLLGGRVVGVGLILGNLIGLGMLYLQCYFHIVPLDPEAYFLTYVPVQLDWSNVLMLNVGACLLATLLMILPASLVSRISPAKTIRYE